MADSGKDEKKSQVKQDPYRIRLPKGCTDFAKIIERIRAVPKWQNFTKDNIMLFNVPATVKTDCDCVAFDIKHFRTDLAKEQPQWLIGAWFRHQDRLQLFGALPRWRIQKKIHDTTIKGQVYIYEGQCGNPFPPALIEANKNPNIRRNLLDSSDEEYTERTIDTSFEAEVKRMEQMCKMSAKDWKEMEAREEREKQQRHLRTADVTLRLYHGDAEWLLRRLPKEPRELRPHLVAALRTHTETESEEDKQWLADKQHKIAASEMYARLRSAPVSSPPPPPKKPDSD